MDCYGEEQYEEELLPDDLVHENTDEDDDTSDLNRDFDEQCYRDLVTNEFDLNENEGSNWTLNRRYRNVLQELRRVVVSSLKRCKEKQASIEKRILELNKPAIKPPSRKNWYHLFGYPYFKDRNFFPCPINDDCKEKLSKNEIDYHQLPPIRRWVEADCMKLEEAVRANAIEMKTLELMKQQGIVLEKLKYPKIKSDEKKNLSKELITINHEIDSIKDMDPVILYGDKNKAFDWLKITAEAFGELRSSEEVQAMWVLCRHPSINRRHWTKVENAALKEIAIRNKEQDWANIAAELNTNRSQFQCVVQYQRNVNTDLINHKWTAEEDEMLQFLVQKCRVGDFIPWATIAMCMNNRTRSQVYNRWQYSINPVIKKGRFTAEEDCLIMAGVRRFGTDFTRVAAVVPGRTTAQIYARYMHCLVRIGPLGSWTKEEDAQLMKLVEEDGYKQWYQLAHYFQNRNRNQVRHRYLYLKEWLNKNPGFLVADAPRRDLGDHSKRHSNLWSQIQKALASTIKEKKKCGNKMEVNDDDLTILKLTMSNVTKKGKWKHGRKKKKISRADKMLTEFGRVSYLQYSGRRRVLYSEEDHQRRNYITMKIFQAMQAHLAFPFDESVIKEDDTLNAVDMFILLELKKKYDERIHMEECSPMEMCALRNSSVPHLVSENQGGSAFSSTSKLQNFVPLHLPGVKLCFPFPEVFPCNLGNIVGFRSLLLSRSNLKIWKTTPKKDVIALPPWRPPNLQTGEKTLKRFTKEESSRLFAERLFTLFMWPTNLARIEPTLQRDTFETNISPAENQPCAVQEHKKKRKRTIQDVARAKSKMMKERWVKYREEKEKKASNEKTNSPVKMDLNEN